MIQATGLEATAVPTARDAPGIPIRRAKSPYEVTHPGEIASSARQTLIWNGVPRRCSPMPIPACRGVEDPPRDAGGGTRILDEGGRLEAAGEVGERLVAPLRSGEREPAHAAGGTQDQTLPER